MRTRITLAAVGVVGVMIAAACGQHSGVHDPSAQTLPSIIIETGARVSADGDVIDDDSIVVDGGTGGGSVVVDGGTGDAPGGDTAGPGDDAGDTGGGDAVLELVGSDRTGVTDDTITVAVHAPVTGAAPLPARAFEEAADLYWRWVTETQGESVLGRDTVRVRFQDDKYAPATARQACRELASSSFILMGGGGTDQIQACGQFAEQAGVPYLSAGVTEAGLQGLRHYFAASMSYKQQGPLLATYVKKNYPDAKVGAIVTQTANFNDAVAGWEDGVARQGIDYDGTRRHAKGNQAWINSYISAMNDPNNPVEVLYMLTAPTDYIQFANQARDQGFRPQFVGVGVTMGLNALFSAGCPAIDGGIWFSPFPGLDWARENVPEFFEAGRTFGAPTDDIALALWAQMATIHEMFKRYESTYGSTDLTREAFVAMLERQQGIQSGIFPQLSYTPDDHFGASQVHVLQASCSAGEHQTLATFASNF